MKKVISSERIPIKMWLDDVEDGPLEQAKNLANLPFSFRHIALMPDCHLGYGMPIGGVMATQGAVSPHAVGVDIGCGVCAVKSNIQEMDTQKIKELMSKVREDIPVGFKRRSTPMSGGMPSYQGKLSLLPIVQAHYTNATFQVGTLGGGNHYWELDKDQDDYIWLTIHSGSRNTGKQVCDHYNAVARELNKMWFSSVPDKWQLAFLPKSSVEYDRYMSEMEWCVRYALYNREVMMNISMGHLMNLTGCSFGETVNIAHNYAAMEHHFGKNVLVHRKGATRARVGELGIIPGSQGTKSYIVRGLGNPQSFESCSHGAGRKMGRRAAKENLDLAAEIKFLDDQGIIHSVRTIGDLDEASGAYKDIDVVMKNQEDLVEIVYELEPLAVVKG